jgi:hypothetical protein
MNIVFLKSILSPLLWPKPGWLSAANPVIVRGPDIPERGKG